MHDDIHGEQSYESMKVLTMYTIVASCKGIAIAI